MDEDANRPAFRVCVGFVEGQLVAEVFRVALTRSVEPVLRYHEVARAVLRHSVGPHPHQPAWRGDWQLHLHPPRWGTPRSLPVSNYGFGLPSVGPLVPVTDGTLPFLGLA